MMFPTYAPPGPVAKFLGYCALFTAGACMVYGFGKLVLCALHFLSRLHYS